VTLPSLVLHDFPHVQISQVLSLLCHPYLPATFSGLRPSLFSSDLPPCYSATCRWWLVVTIIATSIGFDTSRDNVSVKLLLLMVGWCLSSRVFWGRQKHPWKLGTGKGCNSMNMLVFLGGYPRTSFKKCLWHTFYFIYCGHIPFTYSVTLMWFVILSASLASPSHTTLEESQTHTVLHVWNPCLQCIEHNRSLVSFH
jgi:hypothetical protein